MSRLESDEIYTLRAPDFFHGDIQRQDAVTILQKQEHGTYLIRSSHMGEFNFSVRT